MDSDKIEEHDDNGKRHMRNIPTQCFRISSNGTLFNTSTSYRSLPPTGVPVPEEIGNKNGLETEERFKIPLL